MRLIQYLEEGGRRRVGCVREARVLPVLGFETTHELALHAAESRSPIAALVEGSLGEESVEYAPLLAELRVLPPLDHPDLAHLLVSGTGLTHTSSAATRNSMHAADEEAAGSRPMVTDSMKLFQLGLREGKPPGGAVGSQPEWFFKGNGHLVTAPGRALVVPEFSKDAGEEPELVGLYVVDAAGQPCRVGFCLGNELSDHVMERENYLYLAHSKLRPCSLGPELLLGEPPQEIRGRSAIYREGQLLWSEPFYSGEAHMTHTIASLEHHHFKYPLFRKPGDAHAHFFGTATLSFKSGISTRSGDVFEIACDTFGAPLRNALERAERRAAPVRWL